MKNSIENTTPSRRGGFLIHAWGKKLEEFDSETFVSRLSITP